MASTESEFSNASSLGFVSSRRTTVTLNTQITDAGISAKPMDGTSAELALTSDFAPTHFTGFAALKRVVDARRDEIYSNGECGDQYVAFDRVDQDTFEKIKKRRLELMMKATISYFPDIETLIVKIPTRLHEKAHLQLGQLILLKTLVPMNLEVDNFSPMGSTTTTARNRSTKESDSSWKNENIRVRDDDFPSLVVEAGLSESLPRLRADAKWWIENSAGRVCIVVIIWIRRATKTLHIEKYIPGQPETRTSPRLLRQAYANLAATIVINSATGSTTVTGAPLVLEFDRIFDRPPNPPVETDVIFTMQDLQSWADRFWVGV